MSDDFRDILGLLAQGRHLTRGQARQAILYVCSGAAADEDIRGFLLGFSCMQATVEELTGAAAAMRELVVPISDAGAEVLDTCGTGGDVRHTFNISTAAAIIAAGCGVKVVKHGNRSASGKAGSADVLEKLGVNLEPPPGRLEECLATANIYFAFARAFHPAMRHVAAVRRSLGGPTVFNLLGPLTNPANARHHLLGVFSADLTERLAAVLMESGSVRAWVVHAEDGLDEISTLSPTRISELKDGDISTWNFDAREIGLPRAELGELQIANTDEAAAALLGVLENKRGAQLDIALLNASAALVIGGKAAHLADAMPIARLAVESGAAKRSLDLLIGLTGA